MLVLGLGAMKTSGVNGTSETRDRIYDPALGRWTGTDPIAAPLGSTFDSTYTYAQNQPGMYVDPLGDFPHPSLQQVSDFSAGFGDAVTFGGTAWVRRGLGADDVVNRSSWSYAGGTAAGYTAGAAVTGGYGVGGIAAQGGLRGALGVGAYEGAMFATNSAMNTYASGHPICRQDLALNFGLGSAGGAGGSALGPMARSLIARAAARFGAEGGMAAARTAGLFGERSAQIVRNTRHIPSLNGTAPYRIPDELNATTLGEVKNVARLSYTRQLRDFVAYTQQEGLTFNLDVRGSTTFSGPLQEAVDAGLINPIRRLPG